MSNTQPNVPTPAARWRETGEPDPHGTQYDCAREALCLGRYSDDEIANGVFMHGNFMPPLQDIIDGKAHSSSAWLTAAKDRIRWMSRQLVKLLDERDTLREALKESTELLERIAQGKDWGAIEEYIQDNHEALGKGAAK